MATLRLLFFKILNIISIRSDGRISLNLSDHSIKHASSNVDSIKFNSTNSAAELSL